MRCMFEYSSPVNCKTILEASYSTVMYTGRMGTAMMPKVMSNMLCCVQVIAMGEILMVGKCSINEIMRLIT